MNKKPSLFIPIALALTLGLAPYSPEPHIWGKIKWVLGGAEGMQPMDWFDLILHGAPWIYLIVAMVREFKRK
ncbi:hypothetical protein [Ekhidna sp.]|uniref:hypothetical protein n=1 Tax=Ekhidna sp. TaxID=2608089 RepID=UPI003CCC0AA7